MEISYGRKRLAFAKGSSKLLSVTLTERANKGESEQMFTQRLIDKYGQQQGTIEIVIKASQPDYAIITFESQGEVRVRTLT